jgi:hypothetical protein
MRTGEISLCLSPRQYGIAEIPPSTFPTVGATAVPDTFRARQLVKNIPVFSSNGATEGSISTTRNKNADSLASRRKRRKGLAVRMAALARWVLL